jgi:phosphopantothenoylcysteine decarboxylase/phosphopantothenate--cysteine ligase
MLQGRKILVGIGGGIAAYKVCEVISQLFQQGAQVRVVLTEHAQHFITPLTVSTLSRHQAYTDADFWQAHHCRPLHIELGEWADLLLLAPLTAQTLAKLSQGWADNLLTNVVLASRCPILVAPAMNTEMWEQNSVQRNWQLLLKDERYRALEPGIGLLACDRQGSGRLAEPAAIINRLQSWFSGGCQWDLEGKTLLISGGGTREYWDAVRFIGNPATGKMALALVQAALHRGGRVIFVHGPLAIPASIEHSHYQAIAVTTAAQMATALQQNFAKAHWLVMAAAVADVKPAQCHTVKLAKQDLPAALPLVKVPDIITLLAQQKQPHQLVVGFAAQTGDIITPAREKLERKNLDVIVANPVDVPQAGFGSETNQGVILDRLGGQKNVGSCSKLELAHQLWDYLQDYEKTAPP